ncbi:MAG TPA: DUF4276 family protein [archaeon]|nr:DUF4276 family protein [archaeon]
MHVEFLVEEPSMEYALNNLVPRILGQDISIKIHPFQGKHDLLNNLPHRLNGYKKWMPADYRVVVLIDLDQGDCLVLKESLDHVAANAGLITKTQRSERGFFQVLNRLAIEELEAWFFGDLEAVRQAYPRFPEKLEVKENYRDPDAIKGGTCEALERELKKAGYYKSGISKTKAAREISAYMDPDRNRSKSFQVFRDGLLSLERSIV